MECLPLPSSVRGIPHPCGRSFSRIARCHAVQQRARAVSRPHLQRFMSDAWRHDVTCAQHHMFHASPPTTFDCMIYTRTVHYGRCWDLLTMPSFVHMSLAIGNNIGREVVVCSTMFARLACIDHNMRSYNTFLSHFWL